MRLLKFLSEDATRRDFTLDTLTKEQWAEKKREAIAQAIARRPADYHKEKRDELHKQQDAENKKHIAQIFSILHKDCRHYLSLLVEARAKTPFYRGTSVMSDKATTIISTLLYKKQAFKNRRSYGMLPYAFENFNAWLRKHHHTPRDTSISCTSDNEHIGMFGQAFYVFPIGHCNYSWIKALDVNTQDYEDEEVRQILWDMPALLTPEQDKLLNDNITTNKGIRSAYINSYEIWFDCKEYYLVTCHSTSRMSLDGSKLTLKLQRDGYTTQRAQDMK